MRWGFMKVKAHHKKMNWSTFSSDDFAEEKQETAFWIMTLFRKKLEENK